MAKRRASTKRRQEPKPLTITAEEFDRLADLPVHDPDGDLRPYIDTSKTRRPGREKPANNPKPR